MPTTALVTPSYFGDFERFRLLCETIDRHLPADVHHYVLVDGSDLDLFKPLAKGRRSVIDERDILPVRLPHVRQGFDPHARKVWLAWSNGPCFLRGWHVQQLRRIAIAHHVDVDALLYCDSDMAFVRDFDPAVLWNGDDLRLYQVPGGIHSGLSRNGREHMRWTEWAAALLGLPSPQFPANDYINNLVSWRTDKVRAMCAAIEERSDTDWLHAITARRGFSECQIYGAYAADLCGTTGHWTSEQALCRTYWSGACLQETELREFVNLLDPEQVAVGIQSFTRTDPDALRRVLLSR